MLLWLVAKWHNLLYNLLYPQPSDSYSSPMHISKSPLPICVRASSPASDSGASSLSPVGSSAAFSFDNVAENQEGGQQHKGGVLSHYARRDTPLSSPSKSSHSSETSPLHHPTNRNVLQDEGIIIFYKWVSASLCSLTFMWCTLLVLLALKSLMGPILKTSFRHLGWKLAFLFIWW